MNSSTTLKWKSSLFFLKPYLVLLFETFSWNKVQQPATSRAGRRVPWSYVDSKVCAGVHQISALVRTSDHLADAWCGCSFLCARSNFSTELREKMPAISSIMYQNIVSLEMHLPANLITKQYYQFMLLKDLTCSMTLQ